MEKVRGSLGLFICFSLALYGCLNILFGELVPVGNGFGFDGRVLGILAKDFTRLIFHEKAIDSYFIGKSAPSGLAHFYFWVTNTKASNSDIVLFFQILNSLCLIGTAGLWFSISKHLKISYQGVLLGCIGLFVSFSTLKFSYYYPVLTDASALFLGMVLIYAFVVRNNFLLLTAGVIGSFTWPTILPLALLMFVFSRRAQETTESDALFSWVLSSLLVALGLFFHLGLGREVSGNAETIWTWGLVVSAPLLFVYLFFALKPLVSRSIPVAAVKNLSRSRVLWSLFLFVLVYGVTTKLSGSTVMMVSKADILTNLLIEPLAKPLISMVAHHFYFGPIVVLAALSWKDICRAVKKDGLGMNLVFAAILLFSLLSESRSLVAFLPFVVVYTVKVTEGKWSGKSLTLFFILSLVMARNWWPINQGFLAPGGFSTFPNQHYFMNFGPWMSTWSYFIALAAMVLSLLVIIKIQRKSISSLNPGSIR